MHGLSLGLYGLRELVLGARGHLGGTYVLIRVVCHPVD
jgi:hypothetical protein